MGGGKEIVVDILEKLHCAGGEDVCSERLAVNEVVKNSPESKPSNTLVAGVVKDVVEVVVQGQTCREPSDRQRNIGPKDLATGDACTRGATSQLPS